MIVIVIVIVVFVGLLWLLARFWSSWFSWWSRCNWDACRSWFLHLRASMSLSGPEILAIFGSCFGFKLVMPFDMGTQLSTHTRFSSLDLLLLYGANNNGHSASTGTWLRSIPIGPRSTSGRYWGGIAGEWLRSTGPWTESSKKLSKNLSYLARLATNVTLVCNLLTTRVLWLEIILKQKSCISWL